MDSLYTNEQRNIAFKDAVDAATVMGARLRKNPPFREGSILKYKKSLIDDDVSSNSFLHSWPHSIVLKSDEPDVTWAHQISQSSPKCCPFCAPKGRCRSLNELRDHLSTHHPDFTYKVANNGPAAAVITMKLRFSRENNVDPMFVVGAEGYMLSARMQSKYPNYVPPRHLIKFVNPPFLVLQPKIPESYGGFIPGAPGTADVYRNWRRHYELQQVRSRTAKPSNASSANRDRVRNGAKQKQENSNLHNILPSPTPVIDVNAVAPIHAKLPIVTPFPKSLLDINATSTISLGSRSDVSNPSIGEVEQEVTEAADASRSIRNGHHEHAIACQNTVPPINAHNQPQSHPSPLTPNAHPVRNAVPTIDDFALGTDTATNSNNNSSRASDCEIACDNNQRRRRNPKRSARRRFPPTMIPVQSDDDDFEGGEAHVDINNRNRKLQKKKYSASNGSKSRKRAVPREPSGMDNVMTAHLRDAVFGEGAAHLFTAGKGSKELALNERAAHGRLFHSVSNEPLNLEQYNAGYDSDLDDPEELRWRIFVSDKQIFEFIDSTVDDKYFMCLWNSFCARHGRPLGDREVFDTWSAFIRTHGAEVKRAKTEVIMAMNIFHCWEHGSLDVDGVLQLLRLFTSAWENNDDDTDTDIGSGAGCSSNKKGKSIDLNSIPQFEMLQRIVAKDMKYDGTTGLLTDGNEEKKGRMNIEAIRNSSHHAKWAENELNDMAALSGVEQSTAHSEAGLEEWLKEE